MKLIKMLPITLMMLCLSVPALADMVVVSTPMPCSLPETAMIPDYNAKIATLRSEADKSIIAYTAMTPSARVSPDGQGMIQQARDMFYEAQTCQKIADEMALQIPVPTP